MISSINSDNYWELGSPVYASGTLYSPVTYTFGTNQSISTPYIISSNIDIEYNDGVTFVKSGKTLQFKPRAWSTINSASLCFIDAFDIVNPKSLPTLIKLFLTCNCDEIVCMKFYDKSNNLHEGYFFQTIKNTVTVNMVALNISSNLIVAIVNTNINLFNQNIIPIGNNIFTYDYKKCLLVDECGKIILC